MVEQTESVARYVFLSYASAERERALAVSDALQQAGIAVWLDRQAISGGASWSAAIVDGVSGCAAFVVLGSARAFRSPNVQRELNLAVEENRPLLPLLLEQTEQPREVRYALAGRQWVTLADRPTADWLPEVLRALAGLGVGSREQPTLAAPSKVEAKSAQFATTAGYLPAPLTSFLGREQEIAEVAALLESARLVTLTGPGGTGKTRLALAAAQRVADRFPDGVWFVDLSGVADPAGVIPASALTLDVRESEGRSLAVSLAAYLRRKRLLLVLDNFEQVVAAAMALYDLLTEAPGLALLVTSRVLLHVEGEREYAVLPLPLPEIDTPDLPEQLAANPAVQLFVERAQRVRGSFALTAENGKAIAAICRRLDGLPLAIELAAARVKLLPPVPLLARLEQRLAFLTGGERNRPSRQQTLRNTIQWSWDLLAPAQQLLFRRLAVFAGGFTLAAAEAVCNPDGELDVLEGLASLADQSLVRQSEQEGEPRFNLLATLQEFALERLEAAAEAPALRRAHAVYYCTLAEESLASFLQRGQSADVQALARDRDNLLLALPWLLDAGEKELGLRLAAALQMYWYFREPGEGLRWLETFLTRASGDVPPELRGAAHLAAAVAATALGEFGLAPDHANQAKALLRGTPAQTQLAWSLGLAAMYRMPSDAPGARLAFAEARRVALATRAEFVVGFVPAMAAYACVFAQLPAEGLPFAEEALRIGRRLDAEWLTGFALSVLGELTELGGDLQAARGYLEQALPVQKVMQNRFEVAMSLIALASCEAASGKAGALGTWQTALTVSIDLGNRIEMVTAVLGIAEQFAVRGHAAAAVRLLGAVGEDAGEVYPTQFQRRVQVAREQALALVRAALSAEALAQAWAEGQALSLDQATDLALAEPAATPAPASPTSPASSADS